MTISTNLTAVPVCQVGSTDSSGGLGPVLMIGGAFTGPVFSLSSPRSLATSSLLPFETIAIQNIYFQNLISNCFQVLSNTDINYYQS